MRFLAGRLGFYALAAWVSITLSFLLVRLMPGDPAAQLAARGHGRVPPEAVEAMKKALGLSDAPLWEQYGAYVGGVVRGELGVSMSQYPAEVSDVIGSALGWTVLLTGSALLVSFALGVLFGVWAAWRRGGAFDRVVPPVLSLLGAFPYFFLAMLLLFGLGYALEWFPVRHAYDPTIDRGWSWAYVSSVVGHLVLPAFTVVVATIGGWVIGMRHTMVGVLGEDFVTLGHAKGLPPRRVMWRYAARAALLPNVTQFGMALGFVLSGSLLTEIVFAYPGQGYLLVQAVRSLDYPLLQGLFLSITFAVLAANLLVDVATAWLDPRVR